MATPYISMAGIGKSFGPVHALKSVNLTVYPGEIHALLGENGAGKSTLMKVLSGIHEPTKGTITINNINYNKLDHKLAAQLGIGIIYQELSVIDELTVLENLYIGRHLTKKICGVNIIDWREMRVRAAMMLLRVGLKVDLDEKVANLSISHKQMLEIAKTLMLDAKVIIMDEPTSSLTNKEVDYLFLIMNQLRKEGTAIVYISHKLAEIRRICDRYTVMKDGSSVCSGMVSDVSNDDIVRLMVGRELQNRFNAMKENVSNLAHDTVFEVRNVTSRDRKKVRDISFSVCRGEILGFAGLVGSGRTELMNCLFGVDKRAGGEIRLNDKDISPRSPLDAVKKGMAYITESRRDNGFFPNFSIAQNMAISRSLKDGGYKGAMGLFHEVDEQRTAENQRELLALKCHSINQNITELSGGNQQKVLISKWLCCCPEVIIFDEPTRGIDVGAKAEIYKVMRQLADDGKVILMVSSELPEIITVCDRIAVFNFALFWDKYGTFFILAIIVAIFGSLSPEYFLTTNNITQIFVQSSVTVLIGMGEFFAILVAGIDLSVGAILALSGMVTAKLMLAGVDPFLAALIGGVLVGGALGAINGCLVNWTGLHPFIITLGTNAIFRGITLVISDANSVYGFSFDFVNFFAASVIGIPVPVIFSLIVALILWFLTTRMRLGRNIYALGGNKNSAFYSGIDVKFHILVVFIISGVCAGLAGVVSTARLGAAEPLAGMGFETYAIASAIIGGTSFFGGKGRIFSVVIGGLIIGTINNGLNILQVQTYYQLVVMGGLIIAAVALDRLISK